jgi:D-aminoacyl-tRNA deacylase
MQAPTPGPLIVASSTDPASLNIAQNLIQAHALKPIESLSSKQTVYQNGNVRLIILEKECIYVEPEDIPVKADSIIFASKHRSDTGTPAFTVHATGNLTRQAMYGGSPEEVAFVEPFRVHAALSSLSERAEKARLHIEVTMEATHHGPTSFQVPVCFIEVGSGPTEWSSPDLGRIAAEAVMSSATSVAKGTNAVGFGGTHYPTKLTRICKNGTYFVGHVVSKYALDAEVSDPVLQALFNKTQGECKTAVIDWKGLKGEQRRRLTEKLTSWNINIVRC